MVDTHSTRKQRWQAARGKPALLFMNTIIKIITELILGIPCVILWVYGGMYSVMGADALMRSDLGLLAIPLAFVLVVMGPFVLPCLLLGLLSGIARLLKL
jgi:hypothetical protein